MLYGELRRLDQAVEQFDLALQINPDNSEIRELRKQAQNLLNSASP
jgi:hypothetical protein